MSLTYGPKHFDISVASPTQVSVLNTVTGTPATLSAPVSISSDGSVSFTVALPGHYTVVVAYPANGVSVQDKVFLTNIPTYDITDPRSYANGAPGVAAGGQGVGQEQLDEINDAIDGLNDAVALKANDASVVKTVNGQAPVAGNVVVAVSAGSVGSTGITDASSVGRSLITATDSAAARTAIGAGTSNLALGTSSSTAKAGDYQPTSSNISDSTATGRSVLTAASQAAARTAIGAGTSSLAIGTGSGTAPDATTVVTLSGAQSIGGTKTFTSAPAVPDSSFAIAKITGLQTALDAKGTSNLALGTTSTTAKAGDYQPTVANISNATTIGKNILLAADATAVRLLTGTLDETEIDARIQELIDLAPGTLDTLNEIAAALGDDPNFAGTITAELATKAEDDAVVKLTGDQTVAGIKTFSTAPSVPDASFAIAKITNLQTTLDGKAALAHSHAASGISDSTTVGRSVLTAANAAAARTAIGAGTSDIAIGTGSGQAPDATTVVVLTGAQTIGGTKTFSSAPSVPDASFVIAKISGLQTALDAKADSVHTHAVAAISDSTTVGRAVVTAVDAAAARTAIGAGTSSLALGTTSSTAAAGDTVVTLTGSQTIAGTKTFSSAPAVPDNSFVPAKINGLVEFLQDTMSTTLVAGTNVTLTYNDAAGTLTVASTGGTTISSVDDLPLSVPATVTWNGSSWPARSTVTAQSTRRVLWIGNPGGTAPGTMLDNDIWTQG